MKEKVSSKFLSLFILFSIMLISVVACKDEETTPTLSVPTLNNASEVQSTSFKASWSAVTGADKYLLDVSTSSSFSSTVNGFNKKEITGTSTTVTGLTSNTKYYFRVYAKKGTITSQASATKEVTTSNQ